MNINENQMLASFSDEFVKFRDVFLNLRNADYRHERQSGLEDLQAKQNASIAKHDNEIAAKKQEIADLANNANLTDEEKVELRTRKEIELNNLEEAKKIDQEYLTEQEDKYYGTKDELRDKLRTLVADFKEKLGYNNVFGTQMTKIDVLKADINSRIVSVSYQFETIRQQLYATKNSGDKKPLAVEMQKLIEERKRLVDLIARLETFEKTFANFENYLETNDFIEDMDLSNFSNAFELVAEAVVTDVDRTLISVDIITNEDGTYSLDMRCGNKVCDPRPVIPADKFNKNEVDSYLKGFAGVLANKTKMTFDDLTSSNVILKANGADLGRHQFKNVGELAEKVRDGKKDEILAAVGKTGDSKGDQPPVPSNGDQPPIPGSGDQPPVPGNGDQPPVPSNGDQPPVPGEGNQPPVPSNGDDSNDFDDDNSLQGPQGSQGPIVDDHVMKVVAKRNSRSSAFSAAKTAALIAAGGLGLAGMSGLAVAAGLAGGLVAACEAGIKAKDYIKYKAMRHKLKNVAKKMSKATKVDKDDPGVDIRYYENMETRQAGFVLGDSTDILTSDDLHAALPQGMDDDILDVFDHEFEKVNKYRSKGTSARTIKQHDYRDFPQITFDNVTAAFEEWGGLRTRQELMAHKFDIRNIFKSRKKAQEQEELANEENGVEEVDVEEVLSALGDGNQQQGPDNGNVQQGPDNNNQQTGPDNGNGQQGPDNNNQQTGPDNGNGQQGPNNNNQQTGPDNGNVQQGPDNGNGQQGPVPAVVNPLAPSAQEPAVMEMMFPQAEQQAKKDDVVLSMRDKIQDPTNSIEVADLLAEHLRAYKDELSEQSKIDLVNLFHEEVKFTQGQMEKFDFICRNDRTLTDFEAKEHIDRFERIRASKGEAEVGMAISQFINENKGQLTKEDIEALQKFDTKGDFITDAITAEMFNGRTL